MKIIQQKDLENKLKLKKYEKRKEINIVVSKYYEQFYREGYITSGKYERLRNCGTYLQFVADSSLENKRLIDANFCRDRFCPICSKNLAIKNAIALDVITQYLLDTNKNIAFIFLTLTAPNVSGNNLENELRKYSKSFDLFFKYKEIKQVSLGFVRKLEVTYNKKTNTYHTHYHVLIAVKKSYFSGSYYLNHDKWLKLWQKAMKDSSITQVDVRRVTVKNKDINGAILEICKYMAKDNDYLTFKSVFKTYMRALKGKRVLSYSGLFKEARNAFKRGLLDHYLEDLSIEYVYMLLFKWTNNKKYDLDLLKELSEEEKLELLSKFNKKLKGDID